MEIKDGVRLQVPTRSQSNLRRRAKWWEDPSVLPPVHTGDKDMYLSTGLIRCWQHQTGKGIEAGANVHAPGIVSRGKS